MRDPKDERFHDMPDSRPSPMAQLVNCVYRQIGAPALAAIATLALAREASADQVVQIPVDALLNARAVTTLTAGMVVPWTVGVDGGGNSDGYMTAAASKFLNQPATLKTLPDDGVFPADARHPEVVLHFSNDAPATSQQTHYVRGAGNFSFAVPASTYSKLFVFATSSEGTSTLRVTMTYADTTTDVANIVVPDYYTVIPANDPVIFNLASDLPKWTKTNTIAEMNHHNLTGLEIHPALSKVLNNVQIDKTAAGYFVFWGATGIATGAVDAGTDMRDATSGVDAAIDAGSDAAAGGAGGAGTGGSAATGGSGGVAGSGGEAGAATGGAPVGAGGSTGAGGLVGQGGGAPPKSADDSGCSCSVGSRASGQPIGWAIAIAIASLRRRRRGPRVSCSARPR
jgi:MYXO-CTERM domain-containing protein